MAKPAGSAGLVLVESAALLHPGETIFEAMLDGWRRQHAARRLSSTITFQRQRTVRRFAEFTGAWPWQWRAEHLDAWVAQGRWAHSTVRSYQGSIAVFLDYLCDPRYGWAEICQREVGGDPCPDLRHDQPRCARRRLRGAPRAPAIHENRAPGALRRR